MRHMDLFSGIGGFALAASWVWGDEHEIVTFCEKEEFPRKVLKKHWPDVPCVEDIHNLRGDDFGTVDLITGGFPCQPFSVAGKQRGKEDDRYLWPETLRIIQESKPRWFIGENVAGIINLALDDVLASLESSGYSTETFIIPACAVDAPHKRNRVWIVANAIGDQYRQSQSRSFGETEKLQEFYRASNSPTGEPCGTNPIWGTRDHNVGHRESWRRARAQLADGCQWAVEPAVGRVANGVSGRVDRLRGLGNAIVPQVAAVIMSGIKDVDRVL